MNDKDLLTMMKDSFAEVRADTPLTAIQRRGRAVRARRRRGLAGAVAAAAAAVIVVVVVLAQQPGTGTRPGPAPSTRLAAWTVTEKPPGIIEIKLRELKDTAGLQRKLRRDGVPAFVRFQNQDPPGCLNYPLSPAKSRQLSQKIFPEPDNAQMADSVAMVIDVAAIPAGVGVWIEFTPPLTQNQGNGHSVVTFGTASMLVYASGHCPPGG
jgi:hypothetical protein